MTKKLLLILFVVFSSVGCESLAGNERGVRFWKLPTALGGGLSSTGIGSAESFVSIPYISEVYSQEIEERIYQWSEQAPLTFYTQDGILFHVHGDFQFKLAGTDDALVRFFQSLGGDFERAERLASFHVENELLRELRGFHSQDFASLEALEQAVDISEQRAREALRPNGLFLSRIHIQEMNLSAPFRKEKEKLVAKEESIKKELVVLERDPASLRDQKEALARKLERLIVTAQNKRDNLREEGERYFETKQNEAERIRIKGLSQAQGVRKRLQAMSGPNAKAMLKLELVRQLVNEQPALPEIVEQVTEAGGTRASVLGSSVVLDGELSSSDKVK